MIENLLLWVILIVFIIRTCRNVLYQTFLWQLKEYRLDRFIAHLKTPQGRKLLFGPFSLINSFLIFIFCGFFIPFMFFPSRANLWLYAGILSVFLLFLILWSFEAFINILEYFKRGWRVPKPTVKAMGILIIVLVVYIGIAAVNDIRFKFILIPLFDKLPAPLIALLVLLFNIPSYVYKKWMMYRAKQKIQTLKHLRVIGITGSYGKTSTKEFLKTILSQKYTVAKTPEFTNTSIGIAKYIVDSLTDKYEVFIVEMGAYRRGEIREICDVVRPNIGIITAIGTQHLELFGSVENIKRAKFELFESLPKDGAAIVNGEIDHCHDLVTWLKEKDIKIVQFYPSKEIQNVSVKKDGIDCTFIVEKKKHPIHLNLFGRQVLSNVLASIHAGLIAGMDVKNIMNSLPMLAPPPQTMRIVKKSNDVTYVDDTFNANSEGVRAALVYMKLFTGKKILVLTPLIELGGESQSIHRTLGGEASIVCDLVLLTNANFSQSFMDGASVNPKMKVQVVSALEASDMLQKITVSDSVVVFEGKEAGKILNL